MSGLISNNNSEITEFERGVLAANDYARRTYPDLFAKVIFKSISDQFYNITATLLNKKNKILVEKFSPNNLPLKGSVKCANEVFNELKIAVDRYAIRKQKGKQDKEVLKTLAFIPCEPVTDLEEKSAILRSAELLEILDTDTEFFQEPYIISKFIGFCKIPNAEIKILKFRNQYRQYIVVNCTNMAIAFDVFGYLYIDNKKITGLLYNVDPKINRFNKILIPNFTCKENNVLLIVDSQRLPCGASAGFPVIYAPCKDIIGYQMKQICFHDNTLCLYKFFKGHNRNEYFSPQEALSQGVYCHPYVLALMQTETFKHTLIYASMTIEEIVKKAYISKIIFNSLAFFVINCDFELDNGEISVSENLDLCINGKKVVSFTQDDTILFLIPFRIDDAKAYACPYILIDCIDILNF